MKIKNPLRTLSRFEWILWIISLTVVTVSFLLSPSKDFLTLSASLIGVSALIFVSKGLVFGQVLTVVFAVFYGTVSFFFTYYGEMFTYLCLSAPSAIAAIISWLKNPYGETNVVKVAGLTVKKMALMLLLVGGVTVGFYFLLRALGNANLTISTVSVATSALASALTILRSPLYAIAYSANDVVLIVLWILASIENPAYIPMIFCFVMFLANDIYGFINWSKLKREQSS